MNEQSPTTYFIFHSYHHFGSTFFQYFYFFIKFYFYIINQLSYFFLPPSLCSLWKYLNSFWVILPHSQSFFLILHLKVYLNHFDHGTLLRHLWFRENANCLGFYITCFFYTGVGLHGLWSLVKMLMLFIQVVPHFLVDVLAVIQRE